ncbi:uncharacterized protein LOC128239335 [Mya arenaria]|uniref:uncharacterized protein LOC128239335 n=1 Tax=Mya arenaria TaxID=6604 RepID=UPI0022E47C90|nr:uncharacterized protein LOC128239335 [Mya arenaria]XP_052811907.1 uncharacterized protein LOC128239335 [Mya arenaria]XP_052811908.1 uncharacterized protein LOC128239335 [Mya arenaria]XP_052811909.1 uncharacterized protein LOC128239335 [Mya arenaria]
MDQVPGKKLQVDTSALDVTYCQPCSQDGETIPAEAYCTVCKEFMCSNCTSVHKKQRITKSHSLLDKSSMPTTMCGFTTKDESTKPCEIHPEECIKYFCPTHQTLNCGHCSVLDHQSCKQQIISEIAKAFREGQGYKAIKQVIVQLLKDIDACASVVEENTKLVEYLGEHEIAKIRTYRDQINRYFDEREQALIKTIAEMKTMDEILLNSLKPKCVNLKTQVGEIKAKLAAQENNTSQLFIEAHISKNLLEGLQSSLAEIKEKNTIQQYQIRNDPATESLLGSRTGLGTLEKIDTSESLDQRCEHSKRSTTQNEGEKNTTTSDPTSNVQAVRDQSTTTSDTTTNIQDIGDIKATQSTKTFTANTVPEPPLNPSGSQTSAKPKQKTQNKCSKDMMSLTFTSTQDILVKSPSDTKICLLKDVLLLSDDRLLLSDSSNGTMKIVDLKTSSLTSEVNVPGVPWGMCHIPEDMVALSVTHSIQFLETRGKLILRKNIKVDNGCLGVGYHNGSLIISFQSGEVQEIDMEGKVLKVLKVSNSWFFSKSFQDPRYLKIVGDNQTAFIYVSDFEKDTITKLDMNLNILETYTDPALSGPSGITAVRNQLIICGWYSDNIMCLDLPSGKMTQLLGKEEGIAAPGSVCYSQQHNKMYVALWTSGDADNYVKVYNTTPKLK